MRRLLFTLFPGSRSPSLDPPTTGRATHELDAEVDQHEQEQASHFIDNLVPLRERQEAAEDALDVRGSPLLMERRTHAASRLTAASAAGLCVAADYALGLQTGLRAFGIDPTDLDGVSEGELALALFTAAVFTLVPLGGAMLLEEDSAAKNLLGVALLLSVGIATGLERGGWLGPTEGFAGTANPVVAGGMIVVAIGLPYVAGRFAKSAVESHAAILAVDKELGPLQSALTTARTRVLLAERAIAESFDRRRELRVRADRTDTASSEAVERATDVLGPVQPAESSPLQADMPAGPLLPELTVTDPSARSAAFLLGACTLALLAAATLMGCGNPARSEEPAQHVLILRDESSSIVKSEPSQASRLAPWLTSLPAGSSVTVLVPGVATVLPP